MRYSVGTAAKLVGIAVTTLRKWERLDLIPRAKRTEAGWRYYEDEDVEKLRAFVATRVAVNTERATAGSST
jgi:DNA-binding transcriptional MerR regulator